MLYVFYFYGIATYSNDTKCYDFIEYKSNRQLKEKINNQYKNANLSSSPVDRLIKKLSLEPYTNYFTIKFQENQIRLRNNFVKKKGVSYICIEKSALEILTEQKDDLLCKYYCYLRYNCGRSKTKTTDSTASQILEALGYSSSSGEYKTRLSSYNAFLTKNKLITITKQRDAKGRERNIYSLPGA